MAPRHRYAGVILSEPEREQIAAIVRRDGQTRARHAFGDISTESLCRALAQLPIQRGTAALIRIGLAAREAA